MWVAQQYSSPVIQREALLRKNNEKIYLASILSSFQVYCGKWVSIGFPVDVNTGHYMMGCFVENMLFILGEVWTRNKENGTISSIRLSCLRSTQTTISWQVRFP